MRHAKLNTSSGHAIQFGDDFGSEEETGLAQSFDRPVLVHRYPAAAQAFYMASDPERSDLALCMDMLAPEGYGEIIGGGQRIHDLETLREQIESHDLQSYPEAVTPLIYLIIWSL